LKITTWNINSVRLRMPLVQKYLEDQQPDVLCLQETKCRDSEFPSGEFRKLGYSHQAINGQKGYHGVAILSKLELSETHIQTYCGNPDSRHISVVANNQGERFRIHNFYVPAGGDIPDPEENQKFAHKLSFLDEMHQILNADSQNRTRTILVGDLNVAPFEHDVWSHKALLNIVSHTPIEVEKLNRIRDEGRWVDAQRHFVPMSEKLYTWWSYRSPDWSKANKGRRLDHIWVSADLKNNLKATETFRNAREWERPSDHAPVLLHLEL